MTCQSTEHERNWNMSKFFFKKKENVFGGKNWIHFDETNNKKGDRGTTPVSL
jgi:hypothetical protein